MLIFVLLATLLNISSTAPVVKPIDLNPPSLAPLTIFGRDVPIPECNHPENYRTLQGIIWSCVTTIFACTWVSMHPNVPDPHKSGWTNFRWRVITFFYAVIGPEFVTIWALRQRFAAARHMEEYNVKHNLKSVEPSTKWKQVQGWFRDKWNTIRDWFCIPRSRRPRQRSPWTLTHGFLLEMHGLVVVDQAGRPYNPKPPRDSLNEILPKNLSREALIDYYSNVRVGVIFKIDQLPNDFNITEEDVNDKSKCDFFTKLFVVIQTTWFIIQCLARWVTHLHVTELEVITLAFAFLNIATYFLWWNKPQNMNVAIPVQVEREGGYGEVPERVEEEAARHPDRGVSFLVRLHQSLCPDLSPWGDNKSLSQYFWSFNFWLFNTLKSPLDPLVIMLGNIINPEVLLTNRAACVTFFSSEEGIEQPKIAAAMVSIGTFFGGIHLIPFWVSSFPSIWDSYLWVACVAWITVEPVFLLLEQWVHTKRVNRWWWSLLDTMRTSPSIAIAIPGKIVFCAIYLAPIALLPGSLGFLLYVIARGILIYLAFESLHFLPPDAFQDISWSTFFPHI